MKHETVLLEAAVEALLTDPNGVYVDATLGRGGHTAHILQRLGPNGRLISIDRDKEAIEAVRTVNQDKRLLLIQAVFSNLTELLRMHNMVPGEINGILMDLGVSSPQLDTPERGFSFRFDAPLDMRMDKDAGESAAEWLARVSYQDLAQVLQLFGEERHARLIARAIVKQREIAPIQTTSQLADLVAKVMPRREPGQHPATRTFQAIRIWVNRELEHLQDVLPQCVSWLGVGGRLVVISFHSLEDRIVKRFMQNQSAPRRHSRLSPLSLFEEEAKSYLKVLDKGSRPGAEEVKRNPRSRSAVMRVAERIAS